MQKYKPYKFFIITIISTFLIACSSISSSGTYSKNYKNNKKTSLPKVPPKIMPGGNGDNWRYLATTNDNQIAIEINDSSITSNNLINKFQDRKTIISPSSFNYQSLTPKYKYSLSWWQMNCNQKQTLITATNIYDEYGKLLKSYSFDDNNTWTSIEEGSIAEKQYNYICNGVYRNLGY